MAKWFVKATYEAEDSFFGAQQTERCIEAPGPKEAREVLYNYLKNERGGKDIYIESVREYNGSVEPGLYY